MTARCTIRIDATVSPAVCAGDAVHEGQNLCGADAQAAHICPVSGVVQEVRFDPAAHEFVISISPAKGN